MEENPTPLQQAPTPEPKPELTPEEKKVKRKASLKKLGLVTGLTYILVLVLIVVWAFFAAEQSLTFFGSLPISQNAFNNFLMQVLNVMIGILVGSTMLIMLVGMIKSMLAKKDQPEKKKKGTRIAILGGIGFFTLATLWLLALIFIGPKLVKPVIYESPINTDPAVTIGLTAPVDIIFDARSIPIDQGKYQILSYAWNFGDGTTATGEAVSHRFTKKGTNNGRYTVSLDVTYSDIATGAQSNQEFLKEVSIDNELVAAVFTAKPQSGEVPLLVSFDASGSFDPDGEIIAYEWDFDGDGRFDDAEGMKVDYEFIQEGDFEVTLRVTDNNGGYNTTSIMIESGSVGGLRAVIDAPLAEGTPYEVGKKYEFSGELSQIREGNITKYSWDFGDNTVVQSRTANHTFDKAGTYEIVLTVQDAQGNSDDATMEITVYDEGTPPQAIITSTPAATGNVVSGGAPLSVTFDGKASTDKENDIIEFEWDFESDGTIDETGDSASHTYEDNGTYEAKLITTDASGNSDETTVTIEVASQGLVAKLVVTPTNGEVPLTVNFDTSGSTYKEGSIVSYEYNFGDGSDLYIGGSTVTYKYNKVGTFSAEVTVVADDGTRKTAKAQVVIRPVALTSCFTVNTDTGSAPLFVSVDPSCTQGTVSAYEWNFGDGDVSFDRKPAVHTYTQEGTYTIQLEVTSEGGIVNSFEKSVTVN